jgi:hypothetical protein
LNNWLYRIARVLHPYRDSNEIVNLLRAASAGEPIKHGEIERAVERSKATAWKPGQPFRSKPPTSAWPPLNTEQRAAIIRDRDGLEGLWENSSIRIEDNEAHTEEIIDALFPGNPLLCCGLSKEDFDTRSREEWRGKLSMLQFLVPSPMSSRRGLTQEGRISAHALSSTAPRRFLVIEFDDGDVDDHAALFLHLAESAPLALVLHFGNKSLHAWFYCAGQPEERLERFIRYTVSLGADRVMWCRSQFARVPDGTRDNGKRQVVYYFNPDVIK